MKYERFLEEVAESLKIVMGIPIEILNSPFSKQWICYHIATHGHFEQLTEYNGFLTEV